jgi:long-chain fatty acid transport protein
MKIAPRPARSPKFLALTGALALLVLAPLASASGTRVGFKDAFAMGRGNAFVATADNPSAIYYNPAGLTQLKGLRISASDYAVSLTSKYAGAGGTAAMDDGYQSVPQFFTAWHPANEPWAYGFGVYAPFGLSTEWADSSPLRTFALKNKQTYLTFNFVTAYQLSPTLSIGGGVSYNHVTTDLQRRLGVFGPTDLFRFNGKGDAFGFNLGVLWQPAKEHSFGVSYSHHTRVNLKGTTDTIPLVAGEASSAKFDFPEVLILGYSYRPTPEWNFEVNLDWTNWNRVKTVVINKASGAVPLAFNWESGFFYEVGLTRYLEGGWNVSAGYLYTENSTPDATYTPAVPDSNRSFYSLGLGYSSGPYNVNFAWHYADGGTRTVRGSPPSLIGATADGSYKNSINALAVSVDVRF